MKLRYLFIFFIMIYLTGCGQTGPLYLPPKHTPPSTTTKTPPANNINEQH